MILLHSLRSFIKLQRSQQRIVSHAIKGVDGSIRVPKAVCNFPLSMEWLDDSYLFYFEQPMCSSLVEHWTVNVTLLMTAGSKLTLFVPQHSSSRVDGA